MCVLAGGRQGADPFFDWLSLGSGRSMGAEMKFTAKVVPTGRGEYGPFEDGRTIEYLDFADPDGGGTDRATAAQDTDLGDLPLFQPVELAFEQYVTDGNKRKLRTFGKAQAVRAASAA